MFRRTKEEARGGTRVPRAFGGERIRTSEGGANRFTAGPLWPLGYSPGRTRIVAVVGRRRLGPVERFDAVVIGAGPGGSTAAYRLPRPGAAPPPPPPPPGSRGQ